MQQFSDRSHEHPFDFRRNVRGCVACFVAALFVCDGGADVSWRVISVSGHSNNLVRASGFGSQLILYEKFSRQMQNARPAQTEALHIDLEAGLRATQPREF